MCSAPFPLFASSASGPGPPAPWWWAMAATWAAIPHRFEAGTPPIVEAVGLRRAVEYLEKVGMKAVAEHDMALTAYLLDRFRELPDVTVYGPSDLTPRGGVVSFTP